MPPVRVLGIVLVSLVAICFVVEAVVIGGAWWLHRQSRWEDEIGWLEAVRPALPWDSALESQIGKLYRDRIRRDLDAGRLDLAVLALRQARGRVGHAGEMLDTELMALGIETFTRAADRMEARGRLEAAASWDDSLFVMAIRSPEIHHHYAALAAFQEGLDLRVRDGAPCRALARVEWAKRGLGGQIPGFDPSIEEDLGRQCGTSRGSLR